MVDRGGLPPRQRPPLIHQLSTPILVVIASAVIVILITLFMRATAKKTITPAATAAPVAQASATFDSWHSGLPDGPVRGEKPPDPPPPVDVEARQQLKDLAKLMQDRELQTQTMLKQLQDQLAAKTTAPSPVAVKSPEKPLKLKFPIPNSLVLASYTPPARPPSEGTGLMAGTVINATLRIRTNSERQKVVTASVREHIKDSRNPQLTLMPQYSSVILDIDPKRLITGEERLDLALARIELPNRQTIELPKEPVVDQIGQGGLTGEIDHKWRYKIPALLFRGLYAAGVSQVTTLGAPFLAGFQAPGQQIGQTVTEPYLNVHPTILCTGTSPCGEGERVAVILTKDLPLPVYVF